MEYIENLTYATPENINTTGLPKIYFSCHPKDFKELFPKISEAIWKQQNCTILHKKRLNKESDEEFLNYLKENVYLFVFPLTSNFLTTDNYALSQDFVFARENGIPILPLFKETGLENLFNQKCGDYQCLFLNDRDTTSIEFKAKLGKFLSENLIDNNLVKRIHQEFKKHVFISYRKMDRYYVNKLINVLYENEMFRDVAIWYDEYLTPGENFNENIESALDESDLVILATTPNVVKEIKNTKGETVDNYIVTSEYPKVKHKILGVELTPIDRERILSTFPALKDLIHIEQKDELYNTLNSLLNLNKDCDNSPQHKYLIGLAYLNGINVPVDRKKAISLITEAAEDGNLEAMQRLTAFYVNGQFTERCYESAKQWKKKLIKTLKEDYDNTKNATRGHEYAQTLWDFIADEMEQGKPDAVRMHLNELEAFCLEFIRENGNTEKIIYSYLGCLIHSGDYYLREQNPDKALRCFSSALGIVGDDQLKEKALCLDRMGRILLKSETKRAKSCLEEALAIRKRLKSEYDSDHSAQKRNVFQNEQYEFFYLEAMRNLAESHESMALLHDELNNPDAAVSEYETSIAFREEIYLRGKAQSDFDSLLTFRILLANLCFRNENYEKALQNYLCVEKFIKENHSDKSEKELSEVYDYIACCYVNIGDTNVNEGRVEKARNHYEGAMTYLERKLKSLPLNEQSRAFFIHNNMALVLLKIGYIIPDKKLVDQARQIWSNLALIVPGNTVYKSMEKTAEELLARF